MRRWWRRIGRTAGIELLVPGTRRVLQRDLAREPSRRGHLQRRSDRSGVSGHGGSRFDPNVREDLDRR